MFSSSSSVNTTTYSHLYPSIRELLTKFLSDAIGEQLREDDVTAFIIQICKNDADTVEFIASLNPDNVIQQFFPNTQLSQACIDFLKKCTIVFRSQNGLYSYEHGNAGHRVRYQHSMSFIMLFILINFDAHMRIMSVPNRDNIGIWHTGLLKRFFIPEENENAYCYPYQIEIIPPKISDISQVLEELTLIESIAKDFILPVRDDSAVLIYRLQTLRATLADELIHLSSNVNTAILEVYEVLTGARIDSRVSGSYESCASTSTNQYFNAEVLSEEIYTKDNNALYGDYELKLEKQSELKTDDEVDLNPLIFKEAVSEITSENSFQDNPLEEKNDVNYFPDPFNLISVLQKKKISIKDFPRPLNIMFAQGGDVITISKFIFNNDPYKTKIVSTFFEIFFILRLLVLGKEKGDLVGGNAQDKPYKNTMNMGEPEPLPGPLYTLKCWLYGILAGATNCQVEEFLDDALLHSKHILEHHGVSEWSSGIINFTVSEAVFSEMLAGDNLHFFMKAFRDYEKFVNNIKEYEEINNTPSLSLLQELLKSKQIDPKNRAYIRKFKDQKKCLTFESLEREFNVNNGSTVPHSLKVRPATFIIPNVVPIKTYDGDWEHCSGVVILTPPGQNVRMVGYKRRANSNTLIGKQVHTFGFPFSSVETLRPQGGKPSFSEADFFRRIYTVELRTKALLFDMSRKDFYYHYFTQYQIEDKSLASFALCAGDFTCDELEIFAGTKTYDPSVKHGGLFRSLYNLYLLFENTLISFHPMIRKYYMELFSKVINNAIESHVSWPEALRRLSARSKHFRHLAIEKNAYEEASKPSHQQKNLISNPRKYSFTGDTMQSSNEALLQGLIILDNKNHNHTIVTENINFTRNERIQIALQKRHGNYGAIFVSKSTYPAVYVTVKGEEISIAHLGIVNAIIIRHFICARFSQELPFTFFHSEYASFHLLDKDEFKKSFPVLWNQAEQIIIDLMLRFPSAAINYAAMLTSQPLSSSSSLYLPNTSSSSGSTAAPALYGISATANFFIPPSISTLLSSYQTIASQLYPPALRPSPKATFKTHWKSNRSKMLAGLDTLKKKMVDFLRPVSRQDGQVVVFNFVLNLEVSRNDNNLKIFSVRHDFTSPSITIHDAQNIAALANQVWTSEFQEQAHAKVTALLKSIPDKHDHPPDDNRFKLAIFFGDLHTYVLKAITISGPAVTNNNLQFLPGSQSINSFQNYQSSSSSSPAPYSSSNFPVQPLGPYSYTNLPILSSTYNPMNTFSGNHPVSSSSLPPPAYLYSLNAGSFKPASTFSNPPAINSYSNFAANNNAQPAVNNSSHPFPTTNTSPVKRPHTSSASSLASASVTALGLFSPASLNNSSHSTSSQSSANQTHFSPNTP